MEIPQFNKEQKFDELSQILQSMDNTKVSSLVTGLQKAQNHLKQIHDNAYEQGFNDALKFSEKIDKEN